MHNGNEIVYSSPLAYKLLYPGRTEAKSKGAPGELVD